RCGGRPRQPTAAVPVDRGSGAPGPGLQPRHDRVRRRLWPGVAGVPGKGGGRPAAGMVPQRGGYAGGMHLGWLAVATGTLALAAVFVSVRRLRSLALALVQSRGSRLVEDQRRLTAERGLLARVRTSVAPRRIQAWHLEETLLHRWFGRRALRIDTAVGGQENDPRRLRELAPIATPEACDELLRHLVPQDRKSVV